MKRGLALSLAFASAVALFAVEPATAIDIGVKFSIERNAEGAETVIAVDAGGKRHVLGEIKSISETTPLFHWVGSQYFETLVQNGISAENFAERQGWGRKAVAGGGFYTAWDPFSAKGYGNRLTELKVNRKIRYAEFGASELAERFGVTSVADEDILIAVQNSLRDLGLDAWKYNNAWLNFLRNPTDYGTLGKADLIDTVRTALAYFRRSMYGSGFSVIHNLRETRSSFGSVSDPQAAKEELVRFFHAMKLSQEGYDSTLLDFAREWDVTAEDIAGYCPGLVGKSK